MRNEQLYEGTVMLALGNPKAQNASFLNGGSYMNSDLSIKNTIFEKLGKSPVGGSDRVPHILYTHFRK